MVVPTACSSFFAFGLGELSMLKIANIINATTATAAPMIKFWTFGFMRL
jgi:hypothetical protein